MYWRPPPFAVRRRRGTQASAERAAVRRVGRRRTADLASRGRNIPTQKIGPRL